MALYRDLSYFSRDFIVYFRRALALLAGAISGLVVLVFLICLSRLSVARECLGVYELLDLTNVEDSGCTSLRVHLGSLLASGPALGLVLHLPVKCGSRTPGLEFRCRIVSREEGYCVSWVPLGVECVACMTAACMKTLALICLTKLFW